MQICNREGMVPRVIGVRHRGCFLVLPGTTLAQISTFVAPECCMEDEQNE